MPDKNIRDKSDLAPAETDISTASLDDIQDITPSEERIAKAVIQQISYSEFYQGPLPSPKDMKGYQEINPDFPDRIMQMTEKQLDHKIAMEQKALNAGIQSALRGQIIAAFLFLTVLGVGTYMIYTGKDVGGWSLVFVALVGVITSFALGTASSKQQKNSLSENQTEDS
ncbi:DUF2335 domain-containing protein [Faecalibaculum rodentium]|uniref:DUF2335 domain-containing protein n=1 Tax=Faecalibaculum rodentium TaxID=1702221 RepID=UPI00272DB72E|nr:DUF2335 domain-containing protein [Faecalibaculum rodentium]